MDKTKLILSAWILWTLTIISFIFTPNFQNIVKEYYLNKNIEFGERVSADYENNLKNILDTIAEQERLYLEISDKKNIVDNCIVENKNKNLLNCKEELNLVKVDFHQLLLPNYLIICWHWESNWINWKDNWAIYWDISEREMILEYSTKFIEMWFETYWCLEDKKLDEKIEYINYSSFDWVIELHFDVRPEWENVTQWTKVLFANKDWNTPENEDFANQFWFPTNNAYWLKILNSTNKPTVIIEIADPNQPNFEEHKNKLIEYFTN
jgi:hypothetical protein